MASAGSHLKVTAPSPKQMESGCGNRNGQESGNGCISSSYTLHDNFYSTYSLQAGICCMHTLLIIDSVHSMQ